MAADEVEGGVELAVTKGIISFQAKVKTDDVGRGTCRGEFGEGAEFGYGVAHPDAVELPADGVAGSGVGLEMVAILAFHFL